MFLIKNTLHLDINVMPIGALAATLITATLASFLWFLAFPLPDPDKDNKDKKNEKNEQAKKKENVGGWIFNNYFIKPIFTALSVWIASWIFMIFWGFVPDEFYQSKEKDTLVECIKDQQNEINGLKKIAADQNKIIEKYIKLTEVLAHVLKKLKEKYPDYYSWLSLFFYANSKDD